MNSCESYQELISRLVDGEISHDEHDALMAHMKTCSRCNAMYAVFHDLSDILSETPEELPEGLHETIMADVRRSDMRRKNRRMRTIGLRTALTAAACLVLVLFAASGFLPGRGVEDVAIRREEAAALPAPTAAPAAVETAAPAPGTLPAATAAPAALPARTPTPAQDTAPSAPDAYLAAGDAAGAQYNTPQQIQNFPYQPVTPAPEYIPEPVYTQEPVYTPEIVYMPAPVYSPEPVYTPEASDFSVAAEPETVPDPEISASAKRVYAAPQEVIPPEAVEAPVDASVETPAEEIVLNMFSLSMADQDTFDAVSPEDGGETLPPEEPDETVQAQSFVPEELEETESTGDAGTDEAVEEVQTGEPAERKSETQRLTIRGKEARARLLALLGGSEEALPQEAELTRAVHLALVPEDEYGSEEKLDIWVYGDFVFYELWQADGSVMTCRAGCSLAELDAFLRNAEAAPTPEPAPTVDPYA